MILRIATVVAALTMMILPPPANAQDRTPVRIATAAVETAAAVYYAQDLGYFSKAGLDVTISRLDNGAAISAAVIGNAVDVGFANPTSIELAHMRQLPVTVIAGAGIHDSTHPTNGLLVVARTSPIHSGKDLAGKTVAVPGLGIITDLGGRAWIDKDGGDSKQSHYIEMPITAMGPSLIANRVDAAVMDAATAQGQDSADLRILASAMDAIAPKFYASVWFSNTEWVAKNPGAAKKVSDALRDAQIWAMAHPREAVAIFAKHSTFTEADLLRVNRPIFASSLTPEMLQPSIDVAAKYGLLKATFPAKDLIASFGTAK